MENTFETNPSLIIKVGASTSPTATKVFNIKHLMYLEQYLKTFDLLGLAYALDVGYGFATYNPALVRRFVDVAMTTCDQFLVQIMPATDVAELSYAILVRVAE